MTAHEPSHGDLLRMPDRLAGVMLLAGSVRATEVQAATGRAAHDLPIRSGRSILDAWCDEVEEIGRALNIERLILEVLVDMASPSPLPPPKRPGLDLRIERDPRDLRGTAGVLRDVAAGFDDDEFLLVGNAMQIPREPIGPYLEEMGNLAADVSILAHQDGTPSGVSLFRCGALRAIPEVGFVDMKEQALPRIAETHDVRVIRGKAPTTQPVRTLTDYIHLLRAYHRSLGDSPVEEGPFAEDWEPIFSVVEEGAQVDPSARIHDGVVLDGAIVEADAVVVRSIVCPGGRLRPRARALNEMVTSTK